MPDPINDAYVNQLFPGEYCIISIGSKSQALQDYSAFITNFSRTGFDKDYKNERTMGTFITGRGEITPGEVAFDVVFVGSSPNLSGYNVSTPSAGYLLHKLDNSDKTFKIRIEFIEYASGSVGSPIHQNDVAYKEVYYHARGLKMDLNTSAEDYTKGRFTFWIPPFTDKGSSNFRGLAKSESISLTAWGTQETSWNTDVGWS